MQYTGPFGDANPSCTVFSIRVSRAMIRFLGARADFRQMQMVQPPPFSSVANRPEFASLRFYCDAAYKFAEAEKDLKRHTVNAVGVQAIFLT